MNIPFFSLAYKALSIAWKEGHYVFFFGAIFSMTTMLFVFEELWRTAIKFYCLGVPVALYTLIVVHLIFLGIYVAYRYNQRRHGTSRDL